MIGDLLRYAFPRVILMIYDILLIHQRRDPHFDASGLASVIPYRSQRALSLSVRRRRDRFLSRTAAALWPQVLQR